MAYVEDESSLLHIDTPGEKDLLQGLILLNLLGEENNGWVLRFTSNIFAIIALQKLDIAMYRTKNST